MFRLPSPEKGKKEATGNGFSEAITLNGRSEVNLLVSGFIDSVSASLFSRK